MQLRSINHQFAHFAAWQLRFRWLILLIVITFSVFALSGLRLMQAKVSEDDFFAQDDIMTQQIERFETLFGNNEQIAVLIRADDVFAPEVLRAIDAIGKELLAKVPYAERVTSLTTSRVAIGNTDGIAIKNPFENGIPDDKASLEAAQRLILSRQGLVGRLVSKDSKETWLVLSLRAFPDEDEWTAAGQQNPLYQVGEVAIDVLTDSRWHSKAYTLQAAGMPYTETEERKMISSEMPKRVGMGFLLMIGLLSVFLRSLRGVLVPAMTTILGVTVVFGCMGWLGIAVDGNMALLPVFLGMALSVGYSVHLVNAIKRHAGVGNRRQAIVEAVAETGWPIGFTALTTMGSMLSFMSAGIGVTTWLGMVSATVVLTVYLYVMLLIPILFSFGQKPLAINQRMFASPRWATFAGWVLARPRTLVIAGALCIIAMLPALPRINVNMDALEMMGTKIPYLKRIDDIIHSQLGSYVNYNVLLNYDEADTVKEPQVMKNLAVLLKEIGELPLTKKSDGNAKVSSIIDVVREMNQTMHNDDPTFYRIPDNRALIAQLLLLYELSGGKNMYQWIDDQHRSLRAQVELRTFDANEIANELAFIKRRAAELLPNAQLTLVGTAVNFAEMNKRLVTAELLSFLSALLVIAVLMMLVFGSVKTGLIGLLPNFAPVLVIGALMGYGGLSLDMMTMMIMPMMLGIAVDDTIHFISHIKVSFEKNGDYSQAVTEAFTTIGRNLAMTTIILSVAFGIFMTSPLNMIFRIGLMAIIGLFAALVADYLLTPALIYLTRPFTKKNAM